MAEPVQVSGLGCLGRLLSFFGYAWIALAIFGGFAVLEEFGINPGALGSIGGSIIPGFVMIAAGRALKKRGKVVLEKREEEESSSQQPVPDQPQPTSPEAASPKPPRPIVPPPNKPTPIEPSPPPSRSLEDVLDEMKSEPEQADSPLDLSEIGEVSPKSSAEMIEDARRKWGKDSD